MFPDAAISNRTVYHYDGCVCVLPYAFSLVVSMLIPVESSLSFCLKFFVVSGYVLEGDSITLAW